MAIHINYEGRTGNALFQYCFARLISEHNEIDLITNFPDQNIIKTTNHKKYNSISNNESYIIDDRFYHDFRLKNGSSVPKLDKNKSYVISGYFQDADLLNENLDLVKSFFEIPSLEINECDTYIHIRLADFIHAGFDSEILHFDWYNSLVSNMPGAKIISIYNDINWVNELQKNKYLSKLDFNYEIINSLGPIKDFEKHLSYKNVVCSNSTFSWWCAFLGSAENIRTPSWFGYKGVNNIVSHGIHINNLWNIKNKSIKSDNKFIDINQL